MSDRVVRTVVCEGYYDRSFWGQWLENLGLEPQTPDNKSQFGRFAVAGGRLAFRTQTDAIVQVLFPRDPQGRPGIPGLVADEAKDRRRDHWEHLVVCEDSDATDTNAGSGLTAADVRAWTDIPDATQVSVVQWRAADAARPGIPAKQTLERLICAAMVAAYPDCGVPVQAWLDSRPDGPSRIAEHGEAAQTKAFAWSYQAGWFPHRAGDDFFRAVWQDEAIAAQLEKRLAANGAWAIAQALAA